MVVQRRLSRYPQVAQSHPIMLIDPAWLQTGMLAALLATEDTYFQEEPRETEAQRVLDRLLEELPEPMGDAVRMRVIAGYTYQAIAEELGWECGEPPYPNRMKAWRTVKIGLERLRDLIITDTDLQFLIPEEG